MAPENEENSAVIRCSGWIDRIVAPRHDLTNCQLAGHNGPTGAVEGRRGAAIGGEEER